MKNTPEILKQEDIDLVSLASPHIMDSKEALDCTLELLEVYDIYNISSKINKLMSKTHSLFMLIIKGI